MTLKGLFKASIENIFSEFLQSIKTGSTLDTNRIRENIERMRKAFTEAESKQLSTSFRSVEAISTGPIVQLQAEKAAMINQVINNYSYLVEKSAVQSLTIGRRGQDIVREISLQSLREGMINGSPQYIGKDLLLKEFSDRRSSDPGLIEAIKKSKDLTRTFNRVKSRLTLDQSKRFAAQIKKQRAIISEFSERIPIFNQDGRAKFYLHVKPYRGRYIAYDVENYIDLVTSATQREAINEANVAKAARLGTRLVVWNDTGKDYSKTKDHVCARINGKAYSIEPSGTWVAGKFFPYWKNAISGGFSIPHPHCNHTLRPVSEARAADLTPGETLAQRAA